MQVADSKIADQRRSTTAWVEGRGFRRKESSLLQTYYMGFTAAHEATNDPAPR